jgi:hypothetical protein
VWLIRNLVRLTVKVREMALRQAWAGMRTRLPRRPPSGLVATFTLSHSTLVALITEVNSRVEALSHRVDQFQTDNWQASQKRHEYQLSKVHDLSDSLQTLGGMLKDVNHAVQIRHETVLSDLAAVTESMTRLASGVSEMNDRALELHTDAWQSADLKTSTMLGRFEEMRRDVGADTRRLARLAQRLARIESALVGEVSAGSRSIDVRSEVPSQTPSMDGAVIVASSNDNYLPLAKGLWKSLHDTGLIKAARCVWVDIGDAQMTRDWLEHELPQVEQHALPLEVEAFAVELRHDSYQRALFVRPFYASMFPDASVIISVDSDMWVQDPTMVRHFYEAAVEHATSMAVVPVIDSSYSAMFQTARQFHEDNIGQVWSILYGSAVADDFRDRPLLSAGIFAAAPGAPLWKDWAAEIRRHWSRSDVSPNVLHVAEQTALNYLLYSSGRYVLLDALHNYHANLGLLSRGDDGLVRTMDAAHRVVGVVHLSDIVSRSLAEVYVADDLLYQGATALTEAEVERILALSRI